MFRRTMLHTLLIPLALAGCTFDSEGIPGTDDGGAASDDARTFDASTFDASTFDAAIGDDGPRPDALVFDAAIDAQVFDAAPPDATPCVCDDLVDCTDDQCDINAGCVFTDICQGITTCNKTSGLCDGVLTFQQGVNSYAATQDTFLAEGSADAINGALTTIEWDADEPFNSGLMTAGLLVFNQVFGINADQVPGGATINSATLTVRILNGSTGVAGEMREVLVAWTEGTATWDGFGGEPGIQADEVGPVVGGAPTSTCNPCVNVTDVVDVQSSLQAWSTDDSAMRGWAFIPLSTNGIDIASSEAAAADTRPLLTVDFSIAAP